MVSSVYDIIWEKLKSYQAIERKIFNLVIGISPKPTTNTNLSEETLETFPLISAKNKEAFASIQQFTRGSSQFTKKQWEKEGWKVRKKVFIIIHIESPK